MIHLNYLLSHPMAPAAAAAVLGGYIAVAGFRQCIRRIETHSDVETVKQLAKAILDLKPTIGDRDAYDFVATYKKPAVCEFTKKGSIASVAALFRAHARSESYGESPENIISLGQDLIKTKEGQCDNMAAAVIAKIVGHIKAGGAWHSDVELVGTGGHAFVIMNRQGELDDPSTWGKNAVIIDTWLGALGVHPKEADALTAGEYGVVSNPRDVQKNGNFFGKLKVTYKFTAAELQKLKDRC